MKEDSMNESVLPKEAIKNPAKAGLFIAFNSAWIPWCCRILFLHFS